MLHQLPLELLQVIFPLVRNRDLCNISTLCHSLHSHSLNELFHRTGVFKPLSAPGSFSLSCSRPESGSSIRLFRQSQGICITLTSKDNLYVLRGLRIALPYLLDGRQVTVVFCTFSAPFLPTWKEINSLGRFLVQSPFASSIEAVVVDFQHSFAPESMTEYPMPRAVQAITGFLQLFYQAKDERKVLPQCTSLSMLEGTGFGNWQALVPLAGGQPTWLRRGSRTANLMQSLITISSLKIASVFRPTPPPFGLHTLNLNSKFMLDYSFIDYTFSMLAQHSSTLRSLSLNSPTLAHENWAPVLARLSLPHLEELYLGQSGIPLDPLANFLIRHHTLRILDVGNRITGSRVGWRWKRPPHFLPNLRAIKGTPETLKDFLSPAKGSPMARSTLQLVTVIIFTDGLWWSFVSSWLRSLTRFRPNLIYALQVQVKGKWTGWLVWTSRFRNGDVVEEQLILDFSGFDGVKSIEVYIWDMPEFLEDGEVKLNLVSWLERFSALSAVDIVGCNPMGEAHRNELSGLVRAKIPRVESFCVDGVRVV